MKVNYSGLNKASNRDRKFRKRKRLDMVVGPRPIEPSKKKKKRIRRDKWKDYL